jgi:hypothetical protein
MYDEPMIDRAARDKLAERLRHLASGTMTNYSLEEAGIRTMEAGIAEIEFRLAWPHYDDLHEHKPSGSYAINCRL